MIHESESIAHTNENMHKISTCAVATSKIPVGRRVQTEGGPIDDACAGPYMSFPGCSYALDRGTAPRKELIRIRTE